MMKGLKVSNKWGPISGSPIVNASRVHGIFKIEQSTLDTFTKGDPDIGPHLFKAFRPSIIGPIYNRVMKIELEIGGVTI